ncbi:MAG: ComEA family DNA-binding protein [Erysipelotrichaceae bacterium]|nr:ComEA family DNA-binding protein [Erysipelotrichaceae bacterium]
MKLLIFLCLLVTFCCVSYEVVPLGDLRSQSISVRVKGEVEQEEVIELEPYSTLEELLNQVEVNEEADLSGLNESLVLKDGDVITIPKTQEIALISINTATLEQLITLPGIGEATALKIIEYRDTNGLFQNLEDIMKVKGIGEAKYAKLQGYITL